MKKKLPKSYADISKIFEENYGVKVSFDNVYIGYSKKEKSLIFRSDYSDVLKDLFIENNKLHKKSVFLGKVVFFIFIFYCFLNIIDFFIK